ncbi:MAG TPA: hypothetical protein VMW91_01070 [Desulfosporosinus sp.]|nr:hypothetical protein [Desulfosporosinus sp.]
MQVKKPMTHNVRKRISEYSKTQMDISELISGYSIKGEDLSFCYIAELNVSGEDISGCNLTGSKIKIQAQKATAQNCKFIRTEFLQGSSLRGGDFRRSNFYQANAGYIDYAYGDFRGANICGVVLSFASKLGYKAKFAENLVDLVRKWWDIVPSSLQMQDERAEN